MTEAQLPFTMYMWWCPTCDASGANREIPKFHFSGDTLCKGKLVELMVATHDEWATSGD